MGIPWDGQSCWMDSSLMALFFPDKLFRVLYPQFANKSVRGYARIKTTLLQIVDEMRADNGHPSLHEFRSMLTTDTAMRGDQKYAFQPVNSQGYVYYFLQELLKLFAVPCVRAKPPYGVRFRNLHVLEMETCGTDGSATVETCLAKTYRNWRFHPSSASVRHMIIELLDENRHRVQPQERIVFQGKHWELCSMVVFDCSHFVGYLKQDDTWYLFDDTRALSHLEMQSFEFNRGFYQKGMCKFQYGVENTFFFYVRVD